jgi:hypothetical protein
MNEDDYCELCDELEARGARLITVDGVYGWWRDGELLGKDAVSAKDEIRRRS